MHKKSSLITISAFMSSKVVTIECVVYGDIVKEFKKKLPSFVATDEFPHFSLLPLS
jgi:hypothetical protein